jgi:hypothetical protein
MSAAAPELEQLADLAKARHVAVMCFERDEQHVCVPKPHPRLLGLLFRVPFVALR